MLTTKLGTTSYDFFGSCCVDDGQDFISAKMTAVKEGEAVLLELSHLHLKGYLSVPFCPFFALCSLLFKSM